MGWRGGGGGLEDKKDPQLTEFRKLLSKSIINHLFWEGEIEILVKTNFFKSKISTEII